VGDSIIEGPGDDDRKRIYQW